MVLKTVDKYYGVLHTENYFSFYGFCKKVQSDETQQLDVYLDDKLLETITANETLSKIEDIYDLKNFSFTYNLPQKYFGYATTLHFKEHSTQNELKNSPIKLIAPTDKGFAQASFLYSLTKPTNIKCSPKNAIGFFALMDNLDDDDFINILKSVQKQHNDVPLIAFYLSDDIVPKLNSVLENIQTFKVQTIEDIIPYVNIFISRIDNLAQVNYFERVLSEYIFNSKVLLCFRVPMNQKDILYSEFEAAAAETLNFYKRKLKKNYLPKLHDQQKDLFFYNIYKSIIEKYKLNLSLDETLISESSIHVTVTKPLEFALLSKEFLEALKEVRYIMQRTTLHD